MILPDQTHTERADALLLLGIVAAYLTFFIAPIFLNPERTMKFPAYVVKIDPIGLDLAQMLEYSRSWFIRHHSPYVGANPYPPLAAALFAPLLFVKAATAYQIIVWLNVACYALCVVVLPYLLHQRDERRIPLLLTLFLTGLFSHSFHFELERGQFNLIALTCVLSALYLFHCREIPNVWAYALFCVAVQLKAYPALFLILFVKDWTAWKENLLRLSGLALANFLLLFALGVGVFRDFIEALARESSSNVWIGNHSIRAFVRLAPLPHKPAVQVMLTLFVLACLALILRQSYQQRRAGFDAPLFLACTIAALLLPPVSNDYKLTLLTAAMAAAFPHRSLRRQGIQRVFSMALLLACAFSYASTCFSLTNKPRLFKHNLPALFIALCCWTLFTLRQKNDDNHNKERTA